mgnify:CR=1 FL=1
MSLFQIYCHRYISTDLSIPVVNCKNSYGIIKTELRSQVSHFFYFIDNPKTGEWLQLKENFTLYIYKWFVGSVCSRKLYFSSDLYALCVCYPMPVWKPTQMFIRFLLLDQSAGEYMQGYGTNLNQSTLVFGCGNMTYTEAEPWTQTMPLKWSESFF